MKQTLTRYLVKRLSAEEQSQLAADVIAWRFSRFSASEQQVWIQRLSPQLLQAMLEGRVGLRLLLARHLLRLVGLWWLARAGAKTVGLVPRL